MDSKNLLNLLVVLFVIFAFVFTILLFHDPYPSITGNVAGSTSICINKPPSLDPVSCGTNLTQHELYTCQLSGSDSDGDDVSFFFDTNTEMNFSVSSEGLFSVTPTQAMVGVNSVAIGLRDDKNCSNSETTETLVFTVENVNDAPEYVKKINDVGWSRGSSLRGIYLDDRFDDPDGDNLTYRVASASSDFTIKVLDDSEVTFKADDCGEGLVSFSARDPYGASASSGVIEMNVPCVFIGTSSGGGGGGGSSITKACENDWLCENWLPCQANSTQKRRCTDLNGCYEDFTQWFSRDCVYIEHCHNGIRDNDEDGIDCGGPCDPCETCFDNLLNNEEELVDCGGPNCDPCQNCYDGVKNFDEDGIDCGGLCQPCETCEDGIKNQDETGVDCGGVCSVCSVLELPIFVAPNFAVYRLFAVVVLVGGVVTSSIMVFRRRLLSWLKKLLWLLQRSTKKQILLSNDRKELLLKQLQSVEYRFNEKSLSPKEFQVELSHILRHFYTGVVGTSVSQKSITKLSVSSRAKAMLQKQYSLLLRLESSKLLSLEDLSVYTELVRQRVLNFSDVSRQDVSRAIVQKSVSGSHAQQIKRQLYNALLALQFEEVTVAKEKYTVASSLYDALTENQQKELYELLSLVFDDIDYVASYTN